MHHTLTDLFILQQQEKRDRVNSASDSGEHDKENVVNSETEIKSPKNMPVNIDQSLCNIVVIVIM